MVITGLILNGMKALYTVLILPQKNRGLTLIGPSFLFSHYSSRPWQFPKPNTTISASWRHSVVLMGVGVIHLLSLAFYPLFEMSFHEEWWSKVFLMDSIESWTAQAQHIWHLSSILCCIKNFKIKRKQDSISNLLFHYNRGNLNYFCSSWIIPHVTLCCKLC